MKPTEILLDLNDLKLGRIVKKDFEEAVVDISAKADSPAPFPWVKRDKGIETKGAETLPIAPAPKAIEKFEPKIDK